MYKKEIRNCKRLIIFCLFAVAFSGGNFIWEIISDRIFSIVSGLFCAIVCSICVMRSIKTIEYYIAMEKRVEDLMEKERLFNEMMKRKAETDGLDQMH